ncbi:anti-sigma factor domain-containing protein [Methylocella sp.]|uniref:anti-sigma factor n=1 Tax=Methylocella sp. TaxID=1978226 RepID=UPI0037842998
MTEEEEILAAEYALGALHADERTLFVNVTAQNPDVRAAAEAWRARLAPLALAAPPIAPPRSLWERLAAAIEPRGGLPPADDDDDDENDPSLLRRSRARWRSAAIGGAALAACLAGVVVMREIAHQAATRESYVAVVNRGGDLPALVVRVDLPRAVVHVRPVSAQAPEGKSLELWYMGETGAPKSMGLVPVEGAQMRMPKGMTIEKARFAVTVEPKGGSPTGGPTGPMIYSGRLIRD